MFNPSAKKTTLAAFSRELLRCEKESIYEFKHKYPNVHMAIGKWETELKANPHFPAHAVIISEEQRFQIMSIFREEHLDYQDLVFFVLTTFAGMRSQDVDLIYSRNVSRIEFNSKTNIPRMFEIVNEKTKNDPMGKGPVEGRTFRIVCSCLAKITNMQQKKKWIKLLHNTPDTPCYTVCPFQIMVDYLAICPDPYGKETEVMREAMPTIKPLKFMRALTVVAPRIFTKCPLGKNMLSKINNRLNSKLSPEHRVS